jgi:hypothetical protein
LTAASRAAYLVVRLVGRSVAWMVARTVGDLVVQRADLSADLKAAWMDGQMVVCSAAVWAACSAVNWADQRADQRAGRLVALSVATSADR